MEVAEEFEQVKLVVHLPVLTFDFCVEEIFEEGFLQLPRELQEALLGVALQQLFDSYQ